MSWCRREVIRQRRALINPTSVTRNRANDFCENDLWNMIQGGGHEKWRTMYESGWDTVDASSQTTSLEHITTLIWWIGSITPIMDGMVRPWWWNRWMKTTQPEWWYGGKVSCSRATCYHQSFEFLPNFSPVITDQYPFIFCQAWGG